MDVLRSCYSTKVHFKDGDSRESEIRWYWAPEGASPFPARHRFGSLIWSAPSDQSPPVGEIQGRPRPWSNGHPPDGILGTNFCGEESQYLEGIDEFLSSDIPLNPNGNPACCDAMTLCQPWMGETDTPELLTPDWDFRSADCGGGPPTTLGIWWIPDVEAFVWAHAGPGTCGDFPDTVVRLISDEPNLGWDWPLTLTSYDEDTFTGTWEVPSSADHYPGDSLELRFVAGPPPAPCTSLQFDQASSQRVDFTDHSYYALASSDFLLSVWVKFSSDPTAAPMTFFGQDEGPGDFRPKWIFGYKIQGTNKIGFHINGPGIGSGTGVMAVEASWTPTVGTWYQVYVMRNISGWDIGVNGSSLGTSSTFSGAVPHAAVPLSLAFSEAGLYLNGRMMDARLYIGTIPDPSDIYSGGCPDFEDGTTFATVLWAKLDDGSGSIATDSSSHANDGTLANGPTWEDDCPCP